MNGFMIAYVVISVMIIILVLAQKSKDNGFTTMTGAKATDGREVGKTFDKKLQVWTSWLVVAYIILSIVFTFFQVKATNDEQNKFAGNDVKEDTKEEDVAANDVAQEEVETEEVK